MELYLIHNLKLGFSSFQEDTIIKTGKHIRYFLYEGDFGEQISQNLRAAKAQNLFEKTIITNPAI